MRILDSYCPHMGAELCKGWIVGLVEPGEPGQYKLVRQGEFLRCPWHGWEFDIRTGRSWFDPAKQRVKRYPVTLEAETYPVELDRRSIVVTID